MKSVPSLDPQASDPWTFFGSFSREEVGAAVSLLSDAGLAHEVIEDKVKNEEHSPGGWAGPFALWVRDEHAASATSLLVPFFTSKKVPSQPPEPTAPSGRGSS
jgi:hypothetical protein